ncbi:MAG: hypothetical protein ACRDRI_22425 [Pseudonocardiaceae bacterium]
MDTELREAMRQLHRRKDAAYRDSWKKRGEVLSILPNIARKVDRLEYVLDGAPATQDETLFDTAVDLLIYTLKYQTYLADQDKQVAATLFASDIAPPYSDGPKGFDKLLDNLELPHSHQAHETLANAVTSNLSTTFTDITTRIESGTAGPVTERAERAAILVHMAVLLVASLTYEAPVEYRDFLRVNLKGTRDAR